MMTPNKKMLIALLVVVVAVLVGLGMYKKSCACKKAAPSGAAAGGEKKVTIASPETSKPVIKKVSAPEDAKVAPAEPMPVLAA